MTTANDNFLSLFGYKLDEVVGRHHSTFVADDYRASDKYRQFRRALSRGIPQAGEFRLVAKSGREVFVQASYNPIKDREERPIKFVIFAIDVTAQVTRDAAAPMRSGSSAMISPTSLPRRARRQIR